MPAENDGHFIQSANVANITVNINARNCSFILYIVHALFFAMSPKKHASLCQWRIQRGRGGLEAHPLASEFFFSKPLFPYKARTVSYVYLR